MIKKVYCPVCREKVEYEINNKIIREFKGVEVNVEQNIAYCKKCGEELFVEELEKENTKRLYDKYRQVSDTVKPEDIINFREKYNISQRELVAILGWGKMTINRYEKGAIPNQSHNDILKLIINNEDFFKNKVSEAFLKQRISERVLKKIENKFDSSLDFLFKDYINKSLSRKPDIFNGFQSFDLEKLENLISYIASKVDNLYFTSLNKYLFYIDFESFRRFVRSVTGLTYIKYEHGPVIDKFKYYDIVNNLNDKFYKEETEDDNRIETKIISKNNFDLGCFKEKEIEVINDVIQLLKHKSCREISDLSHKEDAWQKNSLRQKISYEYANALKLNFK